jgi:tRNA1(Val) A37 N6-methylase TrmN6
VERQAAYADLARRNAAENRMTLEVVEADLAALPPDLRQKAFDHVIANPPYFDPGRRSPSQDLGRDAALAEDLPLSVWMEVAARRLRPKGYLHVIQRADRLPDLLGTTGSLGSVEVLPLAARIGRAPELVILRARKGGRAPFRLHAPLVLHEGAAHARDGEDYAPAIRAVLRDGAALPWP